MESNKLYERCFHFHRNVNKENTADKFKDFRILSPYF